jgi:hypothetical protein
MTAIDTEQTADETTDYIGSASYSPEDNKLRLYPFARLDKETYDRVKAAGFSWAPKQELFVAPMWTPQREDLLLALCGEIGDEDTSLVDSRGGKGRTVRRIQGFANSRRPSRTRCSRIHRRWDAKVTDLSRASLRTSCA